MMKKKPATPSLSFYMFLALGVVVITILLFI